MTGSTNENNKPKWPKWYKRSVQPFIEETALWPVLVALWGHFVVAIAAFLLNLYRSQSPFLGIIGIWLAFISYKGVQFERMHLGKMAGLSFTIVTTWIGSFLLAYVVDYTGVY